MARRRKQRVKVVERKLGRERAFGQQWPGEGLIEVDPRQKPKAYFNTLIHELLHETFPLASHRKVYRSASVIATTLWDKGYRRVLQ